ncbi:hypothetical protein J6590_037121 [Homalodisca vitripennis]|nr:hypothetical protein J6590_037121 [Homalodisca vitripennis]
MNKKMKWLVCRWQEDQSLRKIYGPTLEDGEWRIKHNVELRQLYMDPDIVPEVRSRRMRWAGHLLRKEDLSQERPCKQSGGQKTTRKAQVEMARPDQKRHKKTGKKGRRGNG